MSYDECHMADGGGYKVFLSQELGFLLPIMEEEHCSIYYINFIHDRTDVLDSSPDDHTDYHQLATDFKIKQFTKFKRPFIDICIHSHDNDCGFYVIKFMELWNSDSFHVPILTENIRQYRSQLLFYCLYHKINEITKLHAGLEPHRPCM
ncbi:hypothetical protein SETIT_9G291500v2 [Setaria italica]|uniref:Ubiquitin-like protease family profile domain-containing protein n=1 Tax=Setaria italica TaxID=4555 RepID=K4AM03_SETIT|nr:hypothetical protein SETIT_9G291500v2 [Setaria italica]